MPELISTGTELIYVIKMDQQGIKIKIYKDKINIVFDQRKRTGVVKLTMDELIEKAIETIDLKESSLTDDKKEKNEKVKNPNFIPKLISMKKLGSIIKVNSNSLSWLFGKLKKENIHFDFVVKGNKHFLKKEDLEKLLKILKERREKIKIKMVERAKKLLEKYRPWEHTKRWKKKNGKEKTHAD